MKVEDIIAEVEKRLGPLDEKAKKAVELAVTITAKEEELSGKEKIHPLIWQRKCCHSNGGDFCGS